MASTPTRTASCASGQRRLHGSRVSHAQRAVANRPTTRSPSASQAADRPRSISEQLRPATQRSSARRTTRRPRCRVRSALHPRSRRNANSVSFAASRGNAPYMVYYSDPVSPWDRSGPRGIRAVKLDSTLDPRLAAAIPAPVDVPMATPLSAETFIPPSSRIHPAQEIPSCEFEKAIGVKNHAAAIGRVLIQTGCHPSTVSHRSSATASRVFGIKPKNCTSAY